MSIGRFGLVATVTLLLTICNWAAAASPVCTSGREDNNANITILFVNGIFNDDIESCRSAKKLKDTYKSSNADVNYDYIHNPNSWRDHIELITHQRIAGDAIAALRAKGEAETGIPYYTELGRQYTSNISKNPTLPEFVFVGALYRKLLNLTDSGRGVVVVPHSQGNNFSEAVFGLLVLHAAEGSISASILQKIRFVGIANVAHSSPNNKYVTLAEDRALMAFEAQITVFGSWLTRPMPRNFLLCRIIDSECLNWVSTGDSSLHGFRETYLNPLMNDPVAGLYLARVIRTLIDDAYLELRSVIPASSGTFTVPALSMTGKSMTVPNKVATCQFSAAGTWTVAIIGSITSGPTGVPGQLNTNGKKSGSLKGALVYRMGTTLLDAYEVTGAQLKLDVTPGQIIEFSMDEGHNQNDYADNSGAVTVSWVCSASAGAASLESSFTSKSTLNAPWSFGWQVSSGAAPIPYASFQPAGSRADYPTLAIWNKVSGSTGSSPIDVYPWVIKNTGASPVLYSTLAAPFPAQSVIVTPGSAGEKAVFRWTAPTAGTYEINASYELMQGGEVDVHVQRNGVDIFNADISRQGSQAIVPAQTVTLSAGDTVDFVVGDGGNTQNSDITRVSASVKPAVGMIRERALWGNNAWTASDVLPVCGVNWYRPGDGGTGKSLLQINHAEVPASASRIFLSLYTRAWDNGGDASAEVYQVTQAWDPATVLWQTIPSTVSAPSATFQLPANTPDNWVKVDITSLVKAWQSGTSNHGMLIDSRINPWSYCRAFYSSNVSGKKPYLSWE